MHKVWAAQVQTSASTKVPGGEQTTGISKPDETTTILAAGDRTQNNQVAPEEQMEFGIIRPEKVAPPFVKATEKEEKFLEVLLHREGSHLLQWRKHLQAFTSIIFSLLINFLRGSKRAPSIIEGFERCSSLDWGMFALFILISMSLKMPSLKQ